ncbi:putative uncharacterized protein [Clostridium sp. CAG:465]|nr:putative uncharacterized protein [Clostridium sp. CAG:465]
MFVNYAHRGASAYSPENTMISFRKALQLGANGIELDLQRTKDEKIVIFHDKNIDKKSNGKGKISDYTYKELLDFDFGSWFDIKYKDERIVLFENFAKEFLSKNLTFAIELKQEGIEKDVLDIIKKYATYDDIYITSFNFNALNNVRAIDSNIKLSWLIEDRINIDNISKLLEINGIQICPNAEDVTIEDIKLANKSGVRVRLWGVSNEDIMRKAFNFNIDGMTVNFPDKLKELMEEKYNGCKF